MPAIPPPVLHGGLVEQEELDKARAAMDTALQVRPDLSVTAVAAMIRPLQPDLKDRFLDAVRSAGLPE